MKCPICGSNDTYINVYKQINYLEEFNYNSTTDKYSFTDGDDIEPTSEDDITEITLYCRDCNGTDVYDLDFEEFEEIRKKLVYRHGKM